MSDATITSTTTDTTPRPTIQLLGQPEDAAGSCGCGSCGCGA
ncbi:hypothetical protein [Cryobacterium sp. CG_9.6]|nr:hypothetical protein [Cryobacterium sp. CG_9.6]MDH6237165.1 hypothetical protein [Cryobacterium sp. CG_9.6]